MFSDTKLNSAGKRKLEAFEESGCIVYFSQIVEFGPTVPLYYQLYGD
jgi:hypothetical protein